MDARYIPNYLLDLELVAVTVMQTKVAALVALLKYLKGSLLTCVICTNSYFYLYC